MTHPSRSSGLSLVELLVTLALASALMVATSALYLHSKVSMTTAQQLAELRENGRYALAVIAADVRRAGYLGEARPPAGPLLIENLPSSLDCDKSTAWGRALQEPVAALNDRLRDVQHDYRACIPTNDHLRGDVLTVRYAAPAPGAPWSNNTGSLAPFLFASVEKPRILTGSEVSKALAAEPATSVYSLHALAYYVAPAQEAGSTCPDDHYPALARRGLDNRGLPRREEITEGIEDMQILLGVDRNGDGSVESFLEPDQTRLGDTVLAVRIWLIARARCSEMGYHNTQSYNMGNRVFIPNDSIRRELFTLTIALRGVHGVYLP